MTPPLAGCSPAESLGFLSVSPLQTVAVSGAVCPHQGTQGSPNQRALPAVRRECVCVRAGGGWGRWVNTPLARPVGREEVGVACEEGVLGMGDRGTSR